MNGMVEIGSVEAIRLLERHRCTVILENALALLCDPDTASVLRGAIAEMNPQRRPVSVGEGF